MSSSLQNLEKVFKHRDLKQKLLETQLSQANLILKEADEKHKIEKELVRVNCTDRGMTELKREITFMQQTGTRIHRPPFSTVTEAGCRVEATSQAYERE